MKLNLVDDNEKLLHKGDAMVYTANGVKKLAIVCPGCGKVSASAGNHVYNEVTKTYHPSIVHDKKLGGCGWHGWLRDGEFKAC